MEQINIQQFVKAYEKTATKEDLEKLCIAVSKSNCSDEVFDKLIELVKGYYLAKPSMSEEALTIVIESIATAA